VKNRDRLNAYNRELRRQHPERWQAYYAKSGDRIRERERNRTAADPETNRRRTKEWAKANPEAVKRNHRKWVLANPEKVAAADRKRRARKLKAEGIHTAGEVLDLFKRQRGKCAYCSTSLKAGYHVDHITPLARGGSNWISNIQLTCAKCNFSKNRSDPIDFAKRLGKLL
jgi:5-methylcytosine-specific restriction endonuclease McrA